MITPFKTQLSIDESELAFPIDYAVFKSKLKFGDIVVNGHASKDNPIRIGVFIKFNKNGKELYLTNTQGHFWNILFDKETKALIIGNVIKDNP